MGSEMCIRDRSTIGTWLRAFTWGHTRQLDAAAGAVLARAWAAGAGPGPTEKLTIDLDSTHCRTYLRHEALCCIPRAAGKDWR